MTKNDAQNSQIRKTKWPKSLQKLAKWLAQVVLHEDVELLRSNAVANQLKLNQLWAAGARVWRKYGEKKVETSRSLAVDGMEWLDLRDALDSVKPIDKV